MGCIVCSWPSENKMAPLLAVAAIVAGLVYVLVKAQGPVAAVIGALLGAFLLALVAVMSGPRLAADAFSERHARRHGLAYARKGPLPQGTWFLNRQTRGAGARGIMTGTVCGRAGVTLAYVEVAAFTGRGSSRQPHTVACYPIPKAPQLTGGIACVPRRRPQSALPAQCAVVPVRDPVFSECYDVGAVTETDAAAASRLFSPSLCAGLAALADGGTRVALEWAPGMLCVRVPERVGSAPELDWFAYAHRAPSETWPTPSASRWRRLGGRPRPSAHPWRRAGW